MYVMDVILILEVLGYNMSGLFTNEVQCFINGQ